MKFPKTKKVLHVLGVLSFLASTVLAIDNLKLNPKLDYNTDSEDGPLITGDNPDAGVVKDKVNHIIIFGEGCFNSKRQARRFVSLYQKYKGRVNFVSVDLNHKLSRQQQELKAKFYTGYIPHVVILDKSGKAVYNQSGEEPEENISAILDKALGDRSSGR